MRKHSGRMLQYTCEFPLFERILDSLRYSPSTPLAAFEALRSILPPERALLRVELRAGSLSAFCLLRTPWYVGMYNFDAESHNHLSV